MDYTKLDSLILPLLPLIDSYLQCFQWRSV